MKRRVLERKTRRRQDLPQNVFIPGTTAGIKVPAGKFWGCKSLKRLSGIQTCGDRRETPYPRLQQLRATAAVLNHM